MGLVQQDGMYAHSYERDRIKYVTSDIIAPSCCHAAHRVQDTSEESAFATQANCV
jgi:hypothetical protein